jgi:hypothetical protein
MMLSLAVQLMSRFCLGALAGCLSALSNWRKGYRIPMAWFSCPAKILCLSLNGLDESHSSGHRNVYGMAWDPATEYIRTSKFGPAGGEEINLIIPGHNYVWTLVSLGRHYFGSYVSDQPWYRDGMDNSMFF